MLPEKRSPFLIGIIGVDEPVVTQKSKLNIMLFFLISLRSQINELIGLPRTILVFPG